MKKYGGAHRVKNVTGMAQISIDLKPNRSVSDVYINQRMDLTELAKYIEKKKKAGEGVTYFHAFLAAIGKTVYNRPKLNYFVANRHIGEKVSKKVESFRKKHAGGVDKKGANSAIDILGKMPNLIRVPLVGFLKWTDEKGLLPASLAEDNLYYSTMIVSNLGSIGCGAIHHNITDFGNSSSLLTMGEIEDHEVIKDGKKEVRKICEWGMNFDERIADGYYFAKSAKVLQYLLSNPELLEEPASQKLDLGELR